MNKTPKTPILPATLKPGDFPLGSPQSRAAARVALEQKSEDGMRVMIEYIGSPEKNRMFVIPVENAQACQVRR